MKIRELDTRELEQVSGGFRATAPKVLPPVTVPPRLEPLPPPGICPPFVPPVTL